MPTNSGGWLYATNGTPVDKDTADNAQARVLEIKQDASKASTDASTALSRSNAAVTTATQAKASADATAVGQAGAIANAAQAKADASTALVRSTSAVSTADRFAQDVEGLKVNAGWNAGSPNDAQNAAFLRDPASKSHAALNAQNLQTVEQTMGLVLVGAALDQARLQAAANEAKSSRRRLWVAGEITTDQTTTIESEVDLGGLTITYTGVGVAVEVGSVNAPLHRVQGTLPRVRRTITGPGQWNGSTGIQLINNDACIWTVPHVENFSVGLDELGDGHGHAYNTVIIGHLANNKVNNRMNAVNGGWSNQNVHIGGRFGHNSEEGTKTPGVRHIDLVQSPNPINNNTWQTPSLEGVAPDYHAAFAGSYNAITDGRFEAVGGARVLWKAQATRNHVRFGYATQNLTESFEAGAGAGNWVWSSSRIRINGDSSGPVQVLENSASNGNAADVIMGAGATNANTPLDTGYSVRRSANDTRMKRPTDLFDRVLIDHLNGQMRLGGGAATPTVGIGVAGAALRLDTLIAPTSTLPAAPAGYAQIVIDGALRKIPYY